MQYSLKIAVRNIINKRSFTIINVTGLSIGLTVFFLLYLYVAYENSYDGFLSNSQNTYRVQLELFQDGKQQFNKATSTYSVDPLMKEKMATVTQYARAGFEKCLVYRDDIKYNDQELFWVDSTFIDVIGIEMLQGDAKTALIVPYSAVLSDKQAKIYFGDEDPIGKIIFINEHLRFTIKGIFKALPENSHLNFKLLLSLSTGNVLWPGWGSNNKTWSGYQWLYTYINLTPGSDTKIIENQLAQFVSEQLPNSLKAKNQEFRFHLQSVTDIHLHSQLDNEFKVNGSAQNTKFLLLIGFLVIIIAWINFINITGTEVFDQAKQIAIRKVNGATQSQLSLQVFFEVFLVHLISMLITLIFIYFSLGLFENLVEIPIRKFLWNKLSLLLILPVLMLIGTIFSGIYPAIVSSSFQPQKVLKGAVFTSEYKFSLKRILVVFQMIATIALIAIALTIEKQLQFVNSKSLGFQKDHIIMVKAPSSLNMDSTKFAKFKTYREIVTRNNQVKEVTSAYWGIGNECFTDIDISDIDVKIIPVVTCKVNLIDEHFTDVFNIKILGGTNFTALDYKIQNKAIINETASRMLGFSSPIEAVGHYLFDSNKRAILIQAVICDFHQESLKQPIKPMLLFHEHPKNFGSYSILISGEKINETSAFLKNEWDKIYPNSPFDYRFLDQQLEQLYFAEVQFGNLLIAFTLLTILIAGLGLFGLIMVVTRRSVKQIGIRKVNGATILEILMLLNKDFVKWVAIAFVIATPIAWYAMHLWLENFAYKTELSWWIFALAGLLALGIALLTVSWQSWKAATRNPVEALRYE